MISFECEKCEHKFDLTENTVDVGPAPDDPFEYILTYIECPKCEHRTEPMESHTCIADKIGACEKYCESCGRDMTPTSYYI